MHVAEMLALICKVLLWLLCWLCFLGDQFGECWPWCTWFIHSWAGARLGGPFTSDIPPEAPGLRALPPGRPSETREGRWSPRARVDPEEEAWRGCRPRAPGSRPCGPSTHPPTFLTPAGPVLVLSRSRAHGHPLGSASPPDCSLLCPPDSVPQHRALIPYGGHYCCWQKPPTSMRRVGVGV